MTATVLGAVIRATPFGPLACSAALSVAVLLTPILVGVELDFLDATLTLHLAMVAMLLGTAFVLDDPARPLTEVLPISARRAGVIRMAVTLVPVTVCWAVLLWLAPMTVASTAPYPRAGLVLEPYALLACVWALAVTAAARRGGRAGTIAAPALLILSVILAMAPDAAAFYVSPGAPGFADSRVRWVALLAAGSLALAVSLMPRRLPALLGRRAVHRSPA
jgi:fluoroquinolone transport system permease protein